MKLCDFMSVAEYAHKNKLTSLPGWKWAKKYDRNHKKFIRWSKIFKAQATHNIIKYKFGIRVPRNVREARQLDEENGNNKWKEAIEKEIG